MGQHCSPASSDLPGRIPLFPLREALLLPCGELPLNIFEPRYIAMVKLAMQSDRLIGMIQPKSNKGDLFSIGCAGRITSFHETDDGRYLITLRGLRRFALKKYALTADNFFLADVTWIDGETISTDFTPPPVCPNKFKNLVDHFLARENLSIDWDEAAHLPEGKFYTILAMLAPFSVTEKQALLEANDLNARCDMLVRLLEMAGPDIGDMRNDNDKSLH